MLNICHSQAWCLGSLTGVVSGVTHRPDCYTVLLLFWRDLYGLVLSSSQRPSTTLLGASVPCTSALHDTQQELGLHSFDLQRASGWKGPSAELLKAGAEALPHTQPCAGRMKPVVIREALALPVPVNPSTPPLTLDHD